MVEDDPDLRELTSSRLSHEGYSLLEAENGEEALAILANGSELVDLIISDVNMPVINGIELAYAWKKMQELRPQFIFLTGGSIIPPEIQKCIAIFSKPISGEDLVKAVEERIGAAVALL